jgi:hypothetical protein
MTVVSDDPVSLPDLGTAREEGGRRRRVRLSARIDHAVTGLAADAPAPAVNVRNNHVDAEARTVMTQEPFPGYDVPDGRRHEDVTA